MCAGGGEAGEGGGELCVLVVEGSRRYRNAMWVEKMEERGGGGWSKNAQGKLAVA